MSKPTGAKVSINFAIRHVHSLKNEAFYFIRQRAPLRYLMNRIRWHYYPKAFLVSRFPDHVDIETSSVCQMRCPMCFLTVRDDVPKNLMSFDLFKRIMKEIARRKPYSIRLSWRGECLLNPRFKEMLAHARSVYDGNISFITNGLKLDEEYLDFFIDQKIDYMVISADGVDETYGEIRKPGNYEDLLNTLRMLKMKKKERGATYPQVRINGVALWFSEGELARYIEDLSPLVDRIQIGEILSNFDDVPNEHDPDVICPSPWQRLMVAWDGKVFPCCDDYSGLYPLGDVNGQSLEEIWHGGPLTQLREWNRNRQRLNCKLCRERDCGIDQNRQASTGVLRERLRKQVVEQYGENAHILKYLR